MYVDRHTSVPTFNFQQTEVPLHHEIKQHYLLVNWAFVVVFTVKDETSKLIDVVLKACYYYVQLKELTKHDSFVTCYNLSL